MPVHERSEKLYFTRPRENWIPTKVSNVATRLRFKNILYASDLSFAAERALPYALEIARRYGATIYVVHVIQPDGYPLVPPSAWSKMAEAEDVFREESKRDLEEQLQSVSHEMIFRPGKTWQTLSQKKSGLTCWYSARTPEVDCRNCYLARSRMIFSEAHPVPFWQSVQVYGSSQERMRS
jgi:hypothetical protein